MKNNSNIVYVEPEFNIVRTLTDDVISTSTGFENANQFTSQAYSKPLSWRSSRVEI